MLWRKYYILVTCKNCTVSEKSSYCYCYKIDSAENWRITYLPIYSFISTNRRIHQIWTHAYNILFYVRLKNNRLLGTVTDGDDKTWPDAIYGCPRNDTIQVQLIAMYTSISVSSWMRLRIRSQ